MPNSSEVTAGIDVVRAVQYNNLRDDILNTSTGHGHTGTGEDGKKLDGADAIQDDTITYNQMASWTRTFWMPASGGYDMDAQQEVSPVRMPGPEGMGIRLEDNEYIVGGGFRPFPVDMAASGAYYVDFTVKPLLYGYGFGYYQASGEIYAKTVCNISTEHYNFSTYVYDTGWQALGSSQDESWDFFYKGPLTISDAWSSTDFISCEFRRDATHTSDTMSHSLFLAGFTIEYTAIM